MRNRITVLITATLLAAACGDDGPSPTGGTGGATGGTGGTGVGATGGANTGGAGPTTGGTGGTGGSGGGTCTIATDCGDNSECQSFTCDAGACNESFTASGTPTQVQSLGDCMQNVCDGAGAITIVDDPSDSSDANDCTDDACDAGVPQHNVLPSGTPCTSNGGKVCDGAKHCVECVSPADCATGVCALDHTCAPIDCGDQVKNGQETDIDCGGPMCGKCPTNKACLTASDCIEGVCDPTLHVCSQPTCTDAVKNSNETDIDCGGPMCPDCAPGENCTSATDCTTSVCSGNPLTCQNALCTDMVKNGQETDTDCGGPTCPDCANGKLCNVGADCVSGVCSGAPKTCKVPSCTDGTKNGTETATDCGGGCPGCVSGSACLINTDCASGLVCNLANVCAAPACNDGLKDGQETDIDCGGPTCADCPDGDTCVTASDCTGGLCLGPPICQSTLNGCSLATAEDHTGEALTTVTQSGFAYTPQCIKIKAGHQVRINANFAGHPLSEGAVVGGVAYPDASGPITHTTAGTTATYTFSTTGAFGYYCDFHYGFGMYGAVFVVP